MAGPRNVTVSDGGTARLRCDVDGSPDNVSVSWILDDGVVVASTAPEEATRRRRYRLDDDSSTLTVVNVSTEDAGTFTCAARNGLGASAAASAHLSVTCTRQLVISRHVICFSPVRFHPAFSVRLNADGGVVQR